MFKIVRMHKLSVIFVLSWIVMSFSMVHAAIEPVYSSILARNDFEGTEPAGSANQDIYVTNASSVQDDGDHKMVAQNNSYAGTDAMGESGRLTFKDAIFDNRPESYMIEFEIKLLQNHAFRYYIRGEDGYIGYLLFANNGKIAFMKSASLPEIGLSPTEETASYGIADYTVGEWTVIGVEVDTNTKTLNYYANGEFICTAAFNEQESGYIQYFLSQSNKMSESVPFIQIDNVQVYEMTEGAFFAKASTDGETISIQFSEWVNGSDIENISIVNTETGKELPIVYSVYHKKILSVKIGESLSSNTEYCVTLPADLTSFSGQQLYSSQIYFMSPVGDGVLKEVVDDSFDEYMSDDEQVNLPNDWTAHIQGSYNHVDFYEDDIHDKAVQVWNTGWTRSIFTRNFGQQIGNNINLEFDFNPTDFNKYLEGEEDPNLLAAVTDSVTAAIGSPASYSVLNQNVGLSFAPVEEDNQPRKKGDGTVLKNINNADVTYVSNDVLVTPPTFFCLYGNRLGFGDFSLPEEGNYVRVEKGKWYHVELNLDMNTLTATGSINGEKIGPYQLPSSINDSQYGSVAARLMFVIPPNAHYNLKGGQVTYRDSNTNEEKIFQRNNDARFALDNVKVSYLSSEFKVEQVRFFCVDDEIFGPLQTISSTVNCIKLQFSEDIEFQDINGDNLQIIDEDGKQYDFEIVSYDNEEFILEIRLLEFLSKGKMYEIHVKNIPSLSGNILLNYCTTFDIEDTGIFRYELHKVIDEAGNELKGDVPNGTNIMVDGYVLNTENETRIINIFISGYKDTDYGEEMVGTFSTTINAAPNTYIRYNSSDGEYLGTMLTGNADYVVAYADIERAYSPKSGELEAWQKSDYTITVSGSAQPHEILKVDIPLSDTEYSLDKASDMFYRNIVTADENGRYEISVSAMGRKTGEYKIYVYSVANESVEETSFVFVTPDDVLNVVRELNGSTSEETTAQIIEQNYSALGIKKDIFIKGSAAKSAKILNAYLRDHLLPENDSLFVSEFLNKIYMISVVSENGVDNLFDYEDLLQLDQSKIKEYYRAEFVSEEMEQKITVALANKNYASIDEFDEELLQQFILKVVESPDGYGNAKKIIQSFSDEIGIKKTYPDSAYRLTINKAYEDYSALINALEENSSVSDQKPGGSSTSGYGGGSSSGNKAGVVDAKITNDDITNQEIKEEVPYNIFTDIENVLWAKQAIVYLAEKGIVNGTSERIFSPNNNLKREEAVKMLILAFASEANEVVVSFDDVPNEAWYYPYVSKALGLGIVKGYSDRLFGTGDNITRQDMAVMIYNAAIAAGYVFDEEEYQPFEDDIQIATYAKKAVYTLKNEGIINGIDGENFAPLAYATRAEAAKIIYSVLKF